MKRLSQWIAVLPGGGQGGFILAMSLVFLLVLTLVASTTHVISRSGVKVGSNYSKTVNAFNIAEVGVIRGKRVLLDYITGGAGDFDGVLTYSAGYSGILHDGATSGTAMQDLVYDEGTYTVTVKNDPEDIAGAGSATNDTDRKIVMVVTAVGKVGNTVQIETYLESLGSGSASVPGVPGAAGICGAASDAKFSGSSLVSGFDWDPPATFLCGGGSCGGTPDYDPAKAGPPMTLEANLGSKLSKTSTKAMEGNPPNEVIDPAMPCDDWKDLAQQLASLGTATVLATDTITGGTMGTRADPEVTIINPPSGTLNLAGTVDGAGVLIVTGNTDVNVSGTFHYEGIILILGDDASFDSGGTSDIFGTILVNNSSPDAALELESGGASNLKYSSKAIQTALEAIEGSTGGGGLLTVAWSEKF